MGNVCFKFKMLIVTLFLVFFVIGSLFAQTDNRLNGRWVNIIDNLTTEYRLNNGNFESFTNGMPTEKGTYSIIHGEIILKPTHIHGGLYNSMILPQFNITYSNFNPEWYTYDDFYIAFKKILLIARSEAEVDWIINYMLSSTLSNKPIPYSVDGNTLSLRVTIGNQSMAVVFNKR